MNNKIKLLSIAIGLTLFVVVSIPVLTNSGINPEHDPLPAIPLFPTSPHPDPGLASGAALMPDIADSLLVDDQYASVTLSDDTTQATQDRIPAIDLVDPEVPLAGELSTSAVFTLMNLVIFSVGVFLALMIVLRVLLKRKREHTNAKLLYISDYMCDSEAIDGITPFEELQSPHVLSSYTTDNERDVA